jgi:hypothetical protein
MPVHAAMPFAAAALTCLLVAAALADPPSGLPEIPPSSTLPAASPAAPATPSSTPAPSPAVAAAPSVTVGGFDASGVTSFRFGDVDVPAGEVARRLGLEVGLRLGGEPGIRLVDANGGFPSDFAVTGSVETAGLVERTRTIKASGYVYRDGSASLTAIARLVRRSDGLVVWSDRVRADLGRESLDRLAAAGALPEATVARLVAEAGGRIADEAVDRLVPLAIAAVEGGEIRLNRGSAGLVIGDRLRVLAAGATGDDPRTVAILEVRTAGATPTLAVVEGDASLVAAGLRVRPIARP